MFFYRGSKLESDLNDLKKECKKTDYERAIEPYQKQINELEKKIYYLNQDMEALYSAGKNLINSIEEDYLKVIVNLDEPVAYFDNPQQLMAINFKEIVVPIKKDLLENYVYWINYYKSKYELEDDK